MEMSFSTYDEQYEYLEGEYQDLLEFTFKYLKLKADPIIGVSIVDNETIHQINRDYRNIDRPTDVISFAFMDDDKNRDECGKKLDEAESILIEKDLRIAEFYAKKKKCAGVFLRLQHIENNFKVTSEKNLKRLEELNKKCPPKSREEYFKIETGKEQEETEKEENAEKKDEQN